MGVGRTTTPAPECEKYFKDYLVKQEKRKSERTKKAGKILSN